MTLEVSTLDKIFYELSRKFHPDLFHGRSEKEKLYSREKTPLLNEAYKTLKDPVTRAEYLLNLEVPEFGKERTKIDPVLVSEIFEIQELVEEENQTKDPALKAELSRAEKEVREKVEARRKALEASFAEWDASYIGRKQELATLIRKTIDEITYLRNLIQSIQTGGQVRH